MIRSKNFVLVVAMMAIMLLLFGSQATVIQPPLGEGLREAPPKRSEGARPRRVS